MKLIKSPFLIISCLCFSFSSMATDKTGTNPVNFTNDFRIYNEYLNLNTKGDGFQNVTTMEYRTPFADGKWQYRVRIREVQIEADLTGNGINNIDSSGEGVVDMRVLTVPYLNMKERKALAVGVEIGVPTGDQVLGSDAITLGPQIFMVFFAPFGIKNSLIAPAYQHKLSIDEEDDAGRVNQSLFDVFFLKTSADKQYWMLINPQYVIDHETQADFGFVDMEAGMMLDKYLGTKGHSAYIRPSFGIGEDRVTDGALEVGYKVVW